MNEKEFKHKVLSLSSRLFPMAVRILGDSEEARDAVQEIMIKLWNKRKQVARHPNINGFVFLTARNYCLDILKVRKKMQFTDKHPELSSDTNDGKADEEELKKNYSVIMKIIDTLPENQRDVIMMRDIDGFEFDEIAEVTGYKNDHIRVLLSRARKNVRTQYKKIHNYEQETIG